MLRTANATVTGARELARRAPPGADVDDFSRRRCSSFAACLRSLPALPSAAA
jgi:hypothetical protein